MSNDFENNNHSTDQSDYSDAKKRRRNNGNAITGIVFIAIGIFWLFGRYFHLDMFDFSAIAQLWPLVFVVIGINMLFKRNRVISMITWSVFILLIILFSNYNLKFFNIGAPEIGDIKNEIKTAIDGSTDLGWNEDEDISFDFNINSGSYKDFLSENSLSKSNFIVPVSEDGKDKFTLEGSASENGIFKMSITALDFTLKGGDINELVATHDFVDVYESNNGTLGFYTHTNEKYESINNVKNKKLDYTIDSTTPWEMQINLGAAEGNLDFTGTAVKKVEINSGASDMKIKLGEADIDVKINSGASDLKFEVPNNVGVRFRSNGVFVDRVFKNDEFVKKDGYYYSSNYDEAQFKADIEVNLAAGEVEVKYLGF